MYSQKNTKNSAVLLGSFMDKILAGFGLNHNLGGWRAVIHWNEIVGEQMAKHSRALRFSDGTLLVSVEESVWRQEMSLNSDRILREIHEKLPGGKAVKRIQFVS